MRTQGAPVMRSHRAGSQKRNLGHAYPYSSSILAAHAVFCFSLFAGFGSGSKGSFFRAAAAVNRREFSPRCVKVDSALDLVKQRKVKSTAAPRKGVDEKKREG